MTTTIATICKKIDIHSHILQGMDHGSSGIQSSVEALKEAKKNKITDIICTPHYLYKNDNYCANFELLKSEAEKLGINLYKGNEIPLNPATITEIKNKKARPLNRSKYLLVELRRNNSYTRDEIKDMTEELIELGYIIIFAHPELIKNTFKKKKDLLFFRELGVLFQIDADSYYLGKKRRVNKLLKLNMVDIIASDFHDSRKSYYYYTKFQNHLINKYGKKYAQRFFYDNPKKVLQNKTITK